jgi:hypothetical protein
MRVDGAEARGGENMLTRALWLTFGVLLITALVGIVFLSIGQLASAPWATSPQSEEVIFVHRATEENVSQNSTYIDHPSSNGNPDAILVVTPNWNPEGSPAFTMLTLLAFGTTPKPRDGRSLTRI